jgi:phage-related protein
MFDVVFLEDADKFLETLEQKAKVKILYNIKKATLVNDATLFKKLVNTEIWEFRTLYNKIQYRIFAFWDKRNDTNTLVICTHGIVKKTQETPKQEIDKAEKIRNEYFNE